jgi:hypothetical protein
MGGVNVARKQAGTTFSDGIDKYIYLFMSILWPQFGKLPPQNTKRWLSLFFTTL